MKIEFHDKLQNPRTTTATRILVSYDEGTPICLILQREPNWVQVFRADDPDFQEQLHQAGIYKTVLVSKIKS